MNIKKAQRRYERRENQSPDVSTLRQFVDREPQLRETARHTSLAILQRVVAHERDKLLVQVAQDEISRRHLNYKCSVELQKRERAC